MQGWFHPQFLKDLLGDGIFTVDGDKWLNQKRAQTMNSQPRCYRTSAVQSSEPMQQNLHIRVSEAAALNQNI